MMTDREKQKEKLIALLANAVVEYTVYNSDGDPVTSYPCKVVNEDAVEILADYLLKSGVVVRDKGEWIHKGPFYQGGIDWYCCPVCGRFAEKDDAFCSKCGADMRKKGNDD